MFEKGYTPHNKGFKGWTNSGSFKKGRVSNRKGIPLSEETKKKISLANKGNPGWNKGLRMSLESRLKMSIAKKGRTTWMKGKKHTLEARKKMSLARLGKPSWNKGVPSPLRGIPRSEETKRKISIGNKGRVYSLETKQKIKEARKNQIFPFKDSKPEVIFQRLLYENGIIYEKHKLFKFPNSWHRVDVFIEPNICVEIDGNYWHKLPNVVERDKIIDFELNKQGYKVLRFWESNIKLNPDLCLKVLYDEMKGNM